MRDLFPINTDLHFHGRYASAVSDSMTPKIIGEQAPLKGLDLIGSADILNANWIKMIKEQLKPVSEDVLQHENGTKFILQTEVEDSNRVHHIILIPSFSKVEELRQKFSKKCKDLDTEGRPKIWMTGEETAEICKQAGCLIGFSHAFTPYFSLYSKFNSYKDCYGRYWKDIHFMELGLSADTDMADRISELHNITLTSNSDAHSPWPNKLGREFNTFLVGDITFDEISKALQRKDGRRCIHNVGFNPLEGKYHKTRCRGCLTFFEPKQAEGFGWRCPQCGNSIKKGVDYRVEELADLPKRKHPEFRPKYTHIIPLSEVIALAFNVKNSWSDNVQTEWKKFVDAFGNEIKVLLEIPIERLQKVNSTVAKYIDYFRDSRINYVPGGAGVYGKLLPPDQNEETVIYDKTQKTLFDY